MILHRINTEPTEGPVHLYIQSISLFDHFFHHEIIFFNGEHRRDVKLFVGPGSLFFLSSVKQRRYVWIPLGAAEERMLLGVKFKGFMLM